MGHRRRRLRGKPRRSPRLAETGALAAPRHATCLDKPVGQWLTHLRRPGGLGKGPEKVRRRSSSWPRSTLAGIPGSWGGPSTGNATTRLGVWLSNQKSRRDRLNGSSWLHSPNSDSTGLLEGNRFRARSGDCSSQIQLWTGNGELAGDDLCVFGQDGTGGYAAFWMIRPERFLADQPVVFLGSEGKPPSSRETWTTSCGCWPAVTAPSKQPPRSPRTSLTGPRVPTRS